MITHLSLEHDYEDPVPGDKKDGSRLVCIIQLSEVAAKEILQKSLINSVILGTLFCFSEPWLLRPQMRTVISYLAKLL